MSRLGGILRLLLIPGVAHAVASALFPLVERLVGCTDRCLNPGSGVVDGDTDGRGNADLPARMYERVILHRRTHHLRYNRSGFATCLGQYQEELFATPAGDGILCSQGGAEQLRKISEHKVTGVVAVLIVNGLEVINIYEGYCKAVGGPQRPGTLVLEYCRGLPAIGQTGERICTGKLVELPVLLFQVDLGSSFYLSSSNSSSTSMTATRRSWFLGGDITVDPC